MNQLQLSDPAAERAVLGGICAYGNDAFLDVADIVNSKAFTIDSNQTIWKCLDHIFASAGIASVDYPSIMSAARSLNVNHLLESPEEHQHLRAILNCQVNRDSVRRMAGKVCKLAVGRNAFETLRQAQENVLGITGEESLGHILGLVENPVMDLSSLLTKSTEGPQRVGDGIRAYAEYLAANQRDVVGIRSGFRHYDAAIGGGFRAGTVNMIGARPKTGKSLLAINMGIRVASGAGYAWPKPNIAECVPVLYLDTEMSKEDQWARLLALVSGATIDEIETGKYASNPLKTKRVSDAIDLLEKVPFDFESIAGQPFEDTLATMRRWVIKRVGIHDNGAAKPCLIIFDYLKLMTAEAIDKRLAEFQVLGFMMTGIHNFAARYRVPVLSFVQLNREGIDTEDTSVAAGSDRVIWFCSNFSIYKKKSDTEFAEQVGHKNTFNRKLKPIVARHGAGLDEADYIHVQSHGATATIVEGPLQSQFSQPERQGIVIDDGQQPSIDFSA